MILEPLTCLDWAKKEFTVAEDMGISSYEDQLLIPMKSGKHFLAQIIASRPLWQARTDGKQKQALIEGVPVYVVTIAMKPKT